MKPLGGGAFSFASVTTTLYGFFKAAPALSGKNVWLVDSDIGKQGEVIFDKRIYSPDIILTEALDTVIIPTVTLKTIHAIRNVIFQKYPTVRNVYAISELCMRQI